MERRTTVAFITMALQLCVFGSMTREQKTQHKHMSHVLTNYIIENSGICDGNPEIFVWVHSAPGHILKRNALRNTWANSKHGYIHHKMAIAFFVGQIRDGPGKRKLKEQMRYENEMYRDIVQEDYIDSYRNLTYKALSGARWVASHCPQAKLVLKADDDALVDLPCLLQQVYKLQKRGRMIRNSMLCTYVLIIYTKQNDWATVIGQTYFTT